MLAGAAEAASTAGGGNALWELNHRLNKKQAGLKS